VGGKDYGLVGAGFDGWIAVPRCALRIQGDIVVGAVEFLGIGDLAQKVGISSLQGVGAILSTSSRRYLHCCQTVAF
jgi:hypothetical protein